MVKTIFFFGRQAGSDANNIDYSIYMGVQAGQNSQNSKHCVFIGQSTGNATKDVQHGIFIGKSAGRTTNSSFSILIGCHAGNVDRDGGVIGTSNIIIGSAATLPNGASNSMNIGNVLYGTGLMPGYESYPVYTPTTNGRIGIGIVNPQHTLDVNGTIRAKEVKVCLDQGCDFVFEPGYNLMPLDELDRFVTTNRHLPEVAPAAVMESEGIELSQMNAMLLQKVEELTLYVIELNKKIQILEENK